MWATASAGLDDAFSPLALEGLALELTAAAGRGPARP